MSVLGGFPSSFIPLVSTELVRCLFDAIDLCLQSGAGEFAEPAQGKYASTTVYSDMDIFQMRSVAPSALHRNANCVLIGADEQGTSSLPHERNGIH